MEQGDDHEVVERLLEDETLVLMTEVHLSLTADIDVFSEEIREIFLFLAEVHEIVESETLHSSVAPLR